MQKIKIANRYGYFDEVTGEYVITRPDTPTPWINYLGKGSYGGIISNTAGGYSFDRDPKNRRVTRYRYNAIPIDQPGRYVYLRDQDSGSYWSPTWQPIPERKLVAYECRHGPGYTRITSRYLGIQSELLYFVPPFSNISSSHQEEEPACELWVLRLRNTSRRPRLLRSFSYVEFSMWNAEADLNNLDWGQHVLHSRIENGIIYVDTTFRPTTSFLASSLPPIGFDTDREVFVGSYHDLSNPIVVEDGKPANSQTARGNNVGVLCHELRLIPGEEKEIIYILGVTDAAEQIAPLVTRYMQVENVRSAFTTQKTEWDEYVSKFQVETPDARMNAMLNVWNQVQCRATLFWSRFVSAYETGLGRGMGTRDSAQDTLAVVQNAPERARQNLSTLWKLQFRDGHTWHQVFPLTGEGGVGLAAEYPNRPQWFCDDHLWLLIAVCAYLRETGDFSYLDERIPYADGGGDDSVWGHMQCAVDFTLAHRGPHGLPRLGFSDWDDTMNLDHGSGKAESVMAAQQFCRTMLDLAELCDHLGKADDGRRYRMLHEDMTEIINRVAWDGEWYARAYDNEGMPVGVQAEEYHKIGLNTQTWAVIGECAPDDRARQAMQSAHKWLNSPFGLAILSPAYTHGDPRIGGTTTYPPGAKENGGIFCHTNTWAIIAAARLGWNNLAYQYYQQIMPLARKDNDVFKVEPYVYCANICGPEHPQFGYGRNSWLSGTASWTYVAGTQWILGIRPTYTGLQIAPIIPEDWTGFKARRIFRGVTYHIIVKRAGSGNATTLMVDGRPMEGNVVPFPPEGIKEVQVDVVLR
jgi:cellobiose phosphorylase